MKRQTKIKIALTLVLLIIIVLFKSLFIIAVSFYHRKWKNVINVLDRRCFFV